MKLSLEQRARRNATRINNQIKRRYPLFAEQFATTQEEQAERLARLDAATADLGEWLAAMSREFWQRGVERRKGIAAILSTEQLAACDAEWDRLHGPNGFSPKVPERGGAYYADHWWLCAKKHAPAWAQEHCPDKGRHCKTAIYEDECPICGCDLAESGTRLDHRSQATQLKLSGV